MCKSGTDLVLQSQAWMWQTDGRTDCRVYLTPLLRRPRKNVKSLTRQLYRLAAISEALALQAPATSHRQRKHRKSNFSASTHEGSFDRPTGIQMPWATKSTHVLTLDQCSNYGGGELGGPGPLSSGSTPDPHYRLALRSRHIRPPENFLIIRPLPLIGAMLYLIKRRTSSITVYFLYEISRSYRQYCKTFIQLSACGWEPIRKH